MYLRRSQARDVLPLVDNAAGGRLEKLREKIEAGGLAGSIRPDQGMDGAARDREIDAAHGNEAPELLGQALRGQDDVVAHFLPTPSGSCRVLAPGVTFLERRSEEHTSELQSLMRISYAVFCLKKKKKKSMTHHNSITM